jgi:hypothetical protein
METLWFFRIFALFFVFLVTLGLNLDDNIVARLGFSANYGFILIIAVVCTAFVAGRHAAIVAIVVVFSLNANMPMDFSLNLGYDRDLYAGLMAALVLQPILMRVIE